MLQTIELQVKLYPDFCFKLFCNLFTFKCTYILLWEIQFRIFMQGLIYFLEVKDKRKIAVKQEFVAHPRMHFILSTYTRKKPSIQERHNITFMKAKIMSSSLVSEIKRYGTIRYSGIKCLSRCFGVDEFQVKVTFYNIMPCPLSPSVPNLHCYVRYYEFRRVVEAPQH